MSERGYFEPSPVWSVSPVVSAVPEVEGHGAAWTCLGSIGPDLRRLWCSVTKAQGPEETIGFCAYHSCKYRSARAGAEPGLAQQHWRNLVLRTVKSTDLIHLSSSCEVSCWEHTGVISPVYLPHSSCPGAEPPFWPYLVDLSVPTREKMSRSHSSPVHGGKQTRLRRGFALMWKLWTGESLLSNAHEWFEFHVLPILLPFSLPSCLLTSFYFPSFSSSPSCSCIPFGGGLKSLLIGNARINTPACLWGLMLNRWLGFLFCVNAPMLSNVSYASRRLSTSLRNGLAGYCVSSLWLYFSLKINTVFPKELG